VSFVKTSAPGLVKDLRTGLIKNTDLIEYHRILKQRKEKLEKQSLMDRVDALENEVNRLSDILNRAGLT
jgi:hypothetical protein